MRTFILSVILTIMPGLWAKAVNETAILSPEFRTLKIQNENDFMAPPVISLGSGERICISFDEMGDDRSYLRYSLWHCRADWSDSDLVESEVLESFNEAEIEDYGFSSGVFRHYVNYRICLPNADMSPLVSGNYLLRVYREGEPDNPVIQARFSISENVVGVSGQSSSLTDRGNNDLWQQLSLYINPGHYRINDPYGELIITVEQNGVDVTPQGAIRPLRVEADRLVYEHNPALIFQAGNEFRRFETVRTDYTGMHVASNRYDGEGYTATLSVDEERASRPYTYDRTQFGRFKVDEYSATDPDLGADYVLTEFTLDFPHVTDGDIYLDGEFVRALPEQERLMHYDPSTGKYTNSLMLKQGSYNYRYVARHRQKGAVSTLALVEGNHYETQNEYVVKVFHRTPGARYDRLIGFTTIH